MRVIGIDISKGVATCCLLETLPTNLKDYSQSRDFTWWHIQPKADDLQALADLKPDLIVYEPTGGKYDEAFAHWMRGRGLDCRKVAGKRLAKYRDDKGLGKNDHLDALSLAAYGLERGQEPGAFIHDPGPEIQQIREWWLQRHSLIRQRGGLTTRLRLQLHKEFPEAAEFDGQIGWGEGSLGIVLWIVGQGEGRSKTTWDNRLTKSFGPGISDYTRFIAQQIVTIQEAINATEQRIDEALTAPVFKPYLDVMDRFQFNHVLKVIWLTRIYPFDKFLDGGHERTSKRLSNNGKWCTHNQSLGQFKAALGAAIDQPSSGTRGGIAPTRQKFKGRSRGKSKGDDKKPQPIGCKYCRVSFWQWATVRIETGKATGELAQKLIAKRNELKGKGKNLYQRSGLLHGYAARLLYRELRRELG
jgi:hypothetical protein